MSFRNAFFTASFICLAGSTIAHASEEHFYSGDYICNGAVNFSEWHLIKRGKNRYSATIFNGRRDQASFIKYDLSGVVSGGKLRLFDGNKPFLEADAPIGQDMINVSHIDDAWHPFSAMNRCQKFSIGKTSSAKDRWKTALELLKSKLPTSHQASEVAYLRRTLPPVAMLPDLDQKSYEDDYNNNSTPFWRAYYAAERSRLNNWPIITEDERKALVEEMRFATSFDLAPEGTVVNNTKAQEEAINFLGLVSERLSSTDTPVRPLEFNGMDRCHRFSSSSEPSSAFVGLIVGFPMDYWDRNLAETIIAQSRHCVGAEGLTQQVVETFPEIEKFRESQSARVDEAFKGMNTSFAKINEARSACTASFMTAKAAGLRNSHMFVKECELRAGVLSNDHERSLVDDQVARILKAPKTLDGLKNNNWFSLDAGVETGWEPSAATIEGFEKRTDESLKEALKVAVDQIDITLSSDDLEKIKSTNVVDVCHEVVAINEDDDIPTPVHESCSNGLSSMEARRDEAECKMAVKTSKTTDDFILGFVAEGDGTIPIRDIICGAAHRGQKVTIATTGFWFWKKNVLSVAPEKGDPTLFYLTQSEKPHVWKAEPADEKHRRAEGYFECLAKKGGCTYDR
jgi:hypothetical protein